MVVALVAAACGGSDEPGALADVAGCGEGAIVDGRTLRVVSTVAPLTDIVTTLAAGTDTTVAGIVPEGTDSHTFEPAPSDAAALERADVVFLNGLGLEEPTRRLALANLSSGGELCELGTTVLPEEQYLYDRSFPEAGGVPNPHLWTSPRWVGEYARLTAEVLAARDPANAGTYTSNLAAFDQRLADLEAAVVAATATIPRAERLLVTYHDAYAYFAADYGWTVVDAVQPSSFDEPSPRDVARLIEQITELGVPVVFGSEVYPSPVLEQIATESGAIYIDDLRDDDLPGEPGDPDHSWFGLMRLNVATIVDALGGDSSALLDG